MGNSLREHRMNPYWEHFAPFDLKSQDLQPDALQENVSVASSDSL